MDSGNGVNLMLAILVILCPPLAVLIAASPRHAVKNFGLTLLFYLPGVLHARSLVERYQVNRRYDSLMRLLEEREAHEHPQAYAA
jgi:uncharacterized membrane protein YqaE (UPF0057 family)